MVVLTIAVSSFRLRCSWKKSVGEHHQVTGVPCSSKVAAKEQPGLAPAPGVGLGTSIWEVRRCRYEGWTKGKVDEYGEGEPSGDWWPWLREGCGQGAARAGASGPDARYQGDAGDQTVHRAEDGGTQPSSRNIGVDMSDLGRTGKRDSGLSHDQILKYWQ